MSMIVGCICKQISNGDLMLKTNFDKLKALSNVYVHYVNRERVTHLTSNECDNVGDIFFNWEVVDGIMEKYN